MTYPDTLLDSPIGTLGIFVDSVGRVTRVDFLDGAAGPPARVGASSPAAARAVTELREYFAGERRTFAVPLAPEGTPFQHAVWGALRQIPYGQTRSYGQLAAALGEPGGARAVGRASATNPIAIIVPCHRLVGADGGLTGYAGGLDRKARLLAFEQGQGSLGLHV